MRSQIVENCIPLPQLLRISRVDQSEESASRHSGMHPKNSTQLPDAENLRSHDCSHRNTGHTARRVETPATLFSHHSYTHASELVNK